MKRKLRPATAMIELIFAIVIMGIVLMSAPQLISNATKSGYVTIQQESINEASSQVNMLLGYNWDENIADETFSPSVLHVSSVGNSDLDENGTSGLRKGTPFLSKRSFIRYDNSESDASTTLGSEGSDRDDIDDFIGDTNLTLVLNSTADYIETDTININTAVIYISDTPVGGSYAPNGSNTITFDFNSTSAGDTTNIKRITVTLTNPTSPTELNKNIVLNAFSCNIGSTEFEEKSF
jgi:hypothetical protein